MDDLSYPFDEWCRRRVGSRSTGYALLRNGSGPKTYVVGTRRYVSGAADREWVQAREAEPAPLRLPTSLRKARGG